MKWLNKANDKEKRRTLFTHDIAREGIDSWCALPLELQSDPNVALWALTSGSLRSAADLPACLQNDREFMLKAVTVRSPLIWNSLPDEFKNDVEFARAIPSFDLNLAMAIFDTHPVLCSDREVWLKVAETLSTGMTLRRLLEAKATREILQDRDIMILACETDPDVLKMIDPSLLRDPVFVDAIVSSKMIPHPLLHIPHEIQSLWPNLMAKSLSKYYRLPGFGNSRWQGLSYFVVRELWINRSFAMAWCKAGGPFVQAHFPEEWREDREIFLLIAENCVDGWGSFGYAAPALTSDKNFMMLVVKFNADLFFRASEELKRNFDLGVVALAGLPPFKYSLLMDPVFDRPLRATRQGGQSGQGDHAFFHSVRSRVCAKLAAYDTFAKVVLPGISLGTGSCCLAFLNQGAETGEVYKKLIAEYYLGTAVERGELRLLRQASNNHLFLEDDLSFSTK